MVIYAVKPYDHQNSLLLRVFVQNYISSRVLDRCDIIDQPYVFRTMIEEDALRIAQIPPRIQGLGGGFPIGMVRGG